MTSSLTSTVSGWTMALATVSAGRPVRSLVYSNAPGSLRPGSVGRPLETVEVALIADGELLIRGPQVMRGYRGPPERTAETIDADGWLHTGDVARCMRPKSAFSIACALDIVTV